MRVLAEANGGPGLTADQLATKLSCPRALVCNDLSYLVFKAKQVTCDREGRYRLGDPTPLLEVQA
jgi:hypothetical protein